VTYPGVCGSRAGGVGRCAIAPVDIAMPTRAVPSARRIVTTVVNGHLDCATLGFTGAFARRGSP
jgi:hypothetical protein